MRLFLISIYATSNRIVFKWKWAFPEFPVQPRQTDFI